MPVCSIEALGSQNDFTLSDSYACPQPTTTFDKDETIGTSNHDLLATSCLSQLLIIQETPQQVTKIDLDRIYKQYEDLFDMVQNMVTRELNNANAAVETNKEDLNRHLQNFIETSKNEQELLSKHSPEAEYFEAGYLLQLEEITCKKILSLSGISSCATDLNSAMSAQRYLSSFLSISAIQPQKISIETDDTLAYAEAVNKGLTRLSAFIEKYSSMAANPGNWAQISGHLIELLQSDIQAAAANALAMSNALKVAN